MRRFLGFALFFTGLGLGAYVFFPTRTPPIAPLTDVPRGETAVARADGDPAAAKQVRVAPPQTQLFVPIGTPPRVVAPEPVTSAATDAVPVDTAKVPVPAPWQVDVAFESAVRAPAPAAAIPRDPYMLIRELQTELRRVGCYDGRIDGSWGPGSKRAMTEFTERVNASLPVEEPDAVLLTLLRGQSARVCGKACPAGQAVAADGTCVSNSLLVDAEGKVRPERRKAEQRTAARRAAAKTAPAPEISSAPATAPVMQPLPSTPYPAAGNVAALRADPLPGRMSVGAPTAGDRMGAAPYADPDLRSGPGVPVPASDDTKAARQAAEDGAAATPPPAAKTKRHAAQYEPARPEKRRKRIVAYDIFLGPDRMGN